MLVNDPVVKVEVGESIGSNALDSLELVVFDGWGPAQVPEICHIVLSTAVDERVTSVVGVHDQVVGSAELLPWEELDSAPVCNTLVGWANGVAADSKARSSPFGLTGVAHIEDSGLMVQVGILGSGACPGVWLEALSGRVSNLIPESHVGISINAGHLLNLVTNDSVWIGVQKFSEEAHTVFCLMNLVNLKIYYKQESIELLLKPS